MTLSLISAFVSSLFLPLQSSTVISLSVRFWDLSQLRYRTLQLQCHYIGDTGTQSTVPPVTIKPLHQITSRLTTKPAARPLPKFQVLCTSQHMSVKLPPGLTSDLFVQGGFQVCSDYSICCQFPLICNFRLYEGM